MTRPVVVTKSLRLVAAGAAVAVLGAGCSGSGASDNEDPACGEDLTASTSASASECNDNIDINESGAPSSDQILQVDSA